MASFSPRLQTLSCDSNSDINHCINSGFVLQLRCLASHQCPLLAINIPITVGASLPIMCSLSHTVSMYAFVFPLFLSKFLLIYIYKDLPTLLLYLNHLSNFRMPPKYGCPIAQVLFPVYSPCIWLIYTHFECFQRLLQLNFDFTKYKIPIPGYIGCIS
jgi:hypothetical protein